MEIGIDNGNVLIKSKKFEIDINPDLQKYNRGRDGKMKISMRIYKRGEDILIGACDEELLGKRLREGKFRLHVKKTFYGGKLVDEKVFEAYLKEATIANLVGRRTVDCAIRLGYVNPDCVLYIQGVPHAQMVKMI